MNIETLAAKYSAIPSHWKLSTLGDSLTAIIGGGTPSRDNPSFWGGDIPWLTVKDMRGRRPTDAQEHITQQAVKESATNIIPPDTVITATRVGLGKVVRVPFATAINQDLKALIVGPDLDKSYLEYWLLSIATFLESIGSGTTVKGIRLETLRQLPIPLAPLQEQREIVAEIEKQFSRLDEAVANLKRYKASVLKAAVEGRLVETEASLAHREGRTYETGEQLLQRILEARRVKWAGRGKFSEPDAPIATETFPIPNGWCISAIPQIATIASGNTPAGILDLVKPEGDIPWFKVGDMNHESNQHSMTHADAWLTHQQVVNLGLRVFPPQTVIFPKRGGAIATNKKRLLSSVGACDLNVMGITPFDDVAPYFFLWFESIDLAKLSDGSNIPQINNKDIVPLIVPFPPLAEQERIVAEVDRHLSIVREVEGEVDTNLKRAQALRQATLAKAFCGVRGLNELD